MFGPHLTIDLYECDKGNLSDETFVKEFLDKLTNIIGMTKISEPFAVFYPGKDGSFDKGGVSGFVLIAESHISIHTFVEQKYASVDIFSCRNFDIKKAENFIIKSLGAKSAEKNLINRGKHFPRDVSKVSLMVLNERRSKNN
jgi:S-adenosylmethionine decarboxylase